MQQYLWQRNNNVKQKTSASISDKTSKDMTTVWSFVTEYVLIRLRRSLQCSTYNVTLQVDLVYVYYYTICI